MNHPRVAVLIFSLNLQVQTFLQGGEPFPKPTNKLPMKVQRKTVKDKKTENIKNFRPDPPNIELLAGDKIRSKSLRGKLSCLFKLNCFSDLAPTRKLDGWPGPRLGHGAPRDGGSGLQTPPRP